MKEAAGEANLTVVAIILIAVVVSVATPLVMSLMKTGTYKACCTDNGGIWEGRKCRAGNAKNMEEVDAVFYAADACVKNALGETHFNEYWNPAFSN